MPFHQYTQCYNHTPGDKPFNQSDLASFALGASAPGLIAAIVSFLSGANVLGFIFIAIQYAVTITAIANEWLFHRLCCVSGDRCAVGTVEAPPKISPLLGSFDNDQFFDIRLMPHRHNDEYKAPNTAFNAATPGPGPSLDGLTETHPKNDIYLDGFQGTTLLKPFFTDLPYDPTVDTVVNDLKEVPDGTKVTRATLHCEAEGNFWAAMKATAALQGLAVGVGGAAGAGAGAAAGCAIGAIFCGIGCVIGAVIGFIAGLAAGAAAGAYLAASAAFNSDPGDVNDANVGDDPLGPLQDKDQVVVFGTHVYDGFHTGWHEIHPLKAIIKATDPKLAMTLPYVEWDPNFLLANGPGVLTKADMIAGLASPAFAIAAKNMTDAWCELLREAFTPATVNTQSQPENRWTIHPAVDGCSPDGSPLPPPPIK
jgi:hypothetical protein